MLSDLSIRLNREEQHLVAAWCVKTAMVFEWMGQTRARFYTRAEREHLRMSLSLPGRTLVWLGRQHRSDFSYCHGKQLSRSKREGEQFHAEGYATTFAAGRLVLQTVTVRLSNSEGRAGRIILDTQSGPWDHGLIQIWPTSTSVQWPPVWSFAESNLEPFAERFRTERSRSE